MRQQRRAGDSERRVWDGHKKKFKRLSVYWCTSFSSQQEFFPCSIITARLPTHKRPRREAESPPDVISSTFTHNHFEEQHVFRCEGLDRVRSMVRAQLTSVMSTGLKDEFSSNMDPAPQTSSDLTQLRSFGPFFFQSWRTMRTTQRNHAFLLLGASRAAMSKHAEQEHKCYTFGFTPICLEINFKYPRPFTCTQQACFSQKVHYNVQFYLTAQHHRRFEGAVATITLRSQRVSAQTVRNPPREARLTLMGSQRAFWRGHLLWAFSGTPV